jgi:signal transduction histidine kinase
MLIATASFDVTDLVLHHQNFNLSQALQETIQFFTVKIKEKNLTLTSDITPNLYLFGDPDLANHLFTVLLDNAVKYSNQGGEIKIYLYRHVHHLHLNISNTGKGIDSHNLPYVFDRFFRDDKARSQKVAGYGLGLTVAKNIINRLNGTIIVTSIPHRFTTFKITLPLKQSPQ